MGQLQFDCDRAVHESCLEQKLDAFFFDVQIESSDLIPNNNALSKNKRE